MTVGSLFSGIGGFDLGFERAGFDIAWQVEIDDYANRVLAKHWPHVSRFRDVRECGAATLAPVDVICGGFPCQPHSLAGRRLASADERDLWGEFARIIREIRPRWVVAENVSGLLSSEAGRFFGRVLGDLAACGYDAEWDCLPASAFGAPHQRDRVWVVAHARSSGHRRAEHLRDVRSLQVGPDRPREAGVAGESSEVQADVADAASRRREGRWQQILGRDCSTHPEGQADHALAERFGYIWRTEPNVDRVAHGIPARVDRLRGLGNAIVPQIAEWIARRIAAAEGVAA